MDESKPETTGEPWEVPESEEHAFAPKRSKYAACVFVINEGERLTRQLERMKPLSSRVDIIIADGGSTDGSVSPERLVPLGVNSLLVKRGPGKLAAQMRMALAYAIRRGYEGVIVIDGNDKDDPAAIPKFVRALDKGYDHVQGSRFLIGGRAVNTPPSRLLGIKLLHAPLISLAAGFHYTDTTNGFRAYSRRLLLDPRVAPFRAVFSRYELHYYLAIRSARLGFKVCERPVTRAYPKGKVPTKISKFRGNLLVLQTLLYACLQRYNPPATVGAQEGNDGQRVDRSHRVRREQPRPRAKV
ncbi:glycosyltransferase family 2 protein [Singulisphaera sp. Ch08]